MKNYITGTIRQIKAIAASAVSSGGVVTEGDQIGVALSDAAIGEEYILTTKGVFELPKAAGAISAGQRIGWTGTECRVATTGDEVLGNCYQDAGASDANVRVDLNATQVVTAT